MTAREMMLPPILDRMGRTRATHTDLKSYRDCVDLLVNNHGLTQSRIADLIGIGQEVISRRYHGHNYPTREAHLVINTLVEFMDDDPDFEGWIL